ncbi:L,D-transpeptidase scaffold domain-containing protein [Pedobacter boryungensis]|uniref:L,D-transpeptidase family protein n=1 Tax=Pedobacter boryungensis TaxID=869962 RepID=A0ABX2D8F1_9SPHI|nr:L,D-transpeptidase family protein [Pedobacter boryungensis]NQX30332.1 L,D-transpeptidase family protein [Pedobacter boryungensis]
MIAKIYSKSTTQKLFLVGILCLFILQSCKKSHSDIGAVVFKETRNKIFKDIETETFVEKFKSTFEKQEKQYRNPKFLRALYESNDFEPVLLMKNLSKDKLKEAVAVLNNSNDHGLDPEIFKARELNDLIEKTYNKKEIKTLDEAYQVLIDLELSAANSLSNYSNALQFGIISPRKIYAQYYTATKRPDSVSFLQIFQTSDIKNFLDSIQPKDKQYLALQKALKDKVVLPGISQEEAQRVLQVNLERLRWKNLPTEDKYVWVNIPDFRLDVMEGGKSVLNMKVCVGEGRNKNNTDNLVEYDENDLKKDRPFSRETPQLKSMIHSVQVNPVWNIPESIATNEISKLAAKDPYYLSNNNIDVFEDGKLVEDPETIDWSDGNVGKKYSFKQRPGDDNSLGKIKFLFNNESSVYLHDTPSKAPFGWDMRAVSHGCVRLEKPLELAEALFGHGDKYDKIKTGMESANPVATDIALPKQVPVYLTYFTCWADDAGKLQFRKDVYGLDIVLFTYLQRLA